MTNNLSASWRQETEISLAPTARIETWSTFNLPVFAYTISQQNKYERTNERTKFICMYYHCLSDSDLVSCIRVSSGQFNKNQCRHSGQRVVSSRSEATDWTQNVENVVRCVR